MITRRIQPLFTLECALAAIGIVLLAAYGLALVHRVVLSRAALRDFDRVLTTSVESPAPPIVESSNDAAADLSLWSVKRIAAFRDSLLINTDLPVAVLRVQKLNIRVPVFVGTDDFVLNRGVGWIAGTARPGESGNIGLAGHRDGIFRSLKDIAPGDTMELVTARSISRYTVEQIQVVGKQDTSVLQSRSLPSLTLVTCYPFYFIGKAPKRFIVHAALRQQVSTNEMSGGSASARTK